MNDLLDQVISYYLDLLPICGSYSKQIQSTVRHLDLKSSESSPFAQALTDADLSVQTFIEVATLAKFPQLSFYGEEHENSYNTKYFSSEGELKIILDPIDGTRFYADGSPYYQIILGILDQHQFQAAIIYSPWEELTLYAKRGGGAFAVKSQGESAVNQPIPLRVKTTTAPLFTYNAPHIVEKLRGEIDILDIAQCYNPNDKRLRLTNVINGDLSGFIGYNAGLIDWGAIAFIAEQAGAVVSDIQGNPLPRLNQLDNMYYDDILVTANQELRDKIVKILK